MTLDIWQYLALTAVSFVALLVYFRIADRFNIIDKPNERSSHKTITIRGAGIIFSFILLVSSAFFTVDFFFITAVILISITGFADDIKNLRPLSRILLYSISLLLAWYAFDLVSAKFYILVIAFILSLGAINTYNFMDGINGISVLYSLVFFVSYWFIYHNNGTLSIPEHYLFLMVPPLLAFSFFNLRNKAKCFMGDAGSVALGLIVVVFLFKLIYSTHNVVFLAMVSLYGIDSVVTIILRIKKKENIFEAHRSHLYQKLVHEIGWSHLTVATIYAIFQTIINIFVYKNADNSSQQYIILSILLLVSAFIYGLVRLIVHRSHSKNLSVPSTH